MRINADYNPANGRFINRDPIGETGGRNLYGFVGNDPVNRVDHLGLSPWGIENAGEDGLYFNNMKWQWFLNSLGAMGITDVPNDESGGELDLLDSLIKNGNIRDLQELRNLLTDEEGDFNLTLGSAGQIANALPIIDSELSNRLSWGMSTDYLMEATLNDMNALQAGGSFWYDSERDGALFDGFGSGFTGTFTGAWSAISNPGVTFSNIKSAGSAFVDDPFGTIGSAASGFWNKIQEPGGRGETYGEITAGILSGGLGWFAKTRTYLKFA